jgi:hypothetical protein
VWVLGIPDGDGARVIVRDLDATAAAVGSAVACLAPSYARGAYARGRKNRSSRSRMSAAAFLRSGLRDHTPGSTTPTKMAATSKSPYRAASGPLRLPTTEPIPLTTVVRNGKRSLPAACTADRLLHTWTTSLLVHEYGSTASRWNGGPSPFPATARWPRVVLLSRSYAMMPERVCKSLGDRIFDRPSLNLQLCLLPVTSCRQPPRLAAGGDPHGLEAQP